MGETSEADRRRKQEQEKEIMPEGATGEGYGKARIKVQSFYKLVFS